MARKRQPGRAGNDEKLPVVASVTRVAEMVGLSRERFYQLIRAGIFPEPRRGDARLKRPFYDEEQQRACIEVRRRGVGVNGQPVLFNEKRRPRTTRRSGRPDAQMSPPAPLATDETPEWLIEGVEGLGLSATKAQVMAAVRACFPGGINEVEHGTVIGKVFRHLYREQARPEV